MAAWKDKAMSSAKFFSKLSRVVFAFTLILLIILTGTGLLLLGGKLLGFLFGVPGFIK